MNLTDARHTTEDAGIVTKLDIFRFVVRHKLLTQ